MFQITTTSGTQTAELLILMVCPAWLPSISRHGSGNLWGRQCLGKMPCMCACSATQLCPTLWSPKDHSLPVPSVHGISQARILNWIAIYFSRVFSGPRDGTLIFCIAGRLFTTESLRFNGYSWIYVSQLLHALLPLLWAFKWLFLKILLRFLLLVVVLLVWKSSLLSYPGSSSCPSPLTS